MKRTKVVAFADDLIIATKRESVRSMENYVNVEINKITAGQRITKKSKVMLVSRRKRKEQKSITVYLNNKPLEQVTQLKYYYTDQKFLFNEHIT